MDEGYRGCLSTCAEQRAEDKATRRKWSTSCFLRQHRRFGLEVGVRSRCGIVSIGLDVQFKRKRKSLRKWSNCSQRGAVDVYIMSSIGPRPLRSDRSMTRSDVSSAPSRNVNSPFVRFSTARFGNEESPWWAGFSLPTVSGCLFPCSCLPQSTAPRRSRYAIFGNDQTVRPLVHGILHHLA